MNIIEKIDKILKEGLITKYPYYCALVGVIIKTVIGQVMNQ